MTLPIQTTSHVLTTHVADTSSALRPRRSSALSALLFATAALSSPACIEDGDVGDVGNGGELTDERASEINAGVFDVGVIPDNGVGCPTGSEEIVIRMDDEDSNNGSFRAGFVGKTNFQETASATRFYFCKVDGTAFRPFSADAANLRDDYAVLKLGTTCPAGSQEFSRLFDNENSNNGNFSNGVIAPNVSTANTRLFFCLFRFAAPGVSTMASFPAFGTGFRYGVFGPFDFNRGALGTGTIRTDDEDNSNGNTYTAPSDALSAAQRIIHPDFNVSTAATFLRIIRAR